MFTQIVSKVYFKTVKEYNKIRNEQIHSIN